MDDRAPHGPGLEEAPLAGAPGGWPGAATRAVIPLGVRRRPLAAAPFEPDAVAAAAASALLPALRVLILEGDDEDYAITEAMLGRAEDAAYVVERAASFENGLARLLEGGFDVCLCDYAATPHRDGLEFVRVAVRRGCRTPIILTAAYAEPELQAEALEAGAVDLIEKEELDVQRLDRALRFAVARERRVERLSRLAQQDELTGLANRALFSDRLERALAAARRHRTLIAVMVIDLNGFKAVNDRLGHVAGDQLLRLVGERLRARVRETDTVARLGGDEFAIVLENLGRPEYAGLVARKLLDAVAPPVQLDGREASVTASIGAALFPRDGSEAPLLLRHADAAMYRAKAEGGNLCCFHDERLDTRAQRQALQAAELRRAIERDELVLHFQPQVTLCAPELGLASLMRWRHPELGLVDAERIRALAEEAGLMEALTDWLIGAACRQARRWRDAGLRRLHVALPLLSRRQLGWSQLADRLDARLRAEDLPPHWLELEVDERLLLEEVAAGGSALPPLRELGVRLALDGFGSGPSSLNLLRDAPLSTVKLSRGFLQGTPKDEHRALFTGAVVALAKRLGLRLVAEGIESQAQLQMLRGQGCDAVQAFMSCPPLPAEACTDWLREAAARA